MVKKNVLVIGSDGQLGGCLKDVVSQKQSGLPSDSKEGAKWFFKSYPELDINDREAIENIVEAEDIGVIVNCAAWTDVEGAEKPENRDAVYKVNAEGPKTLAEICKGHDLFLVHISTDYVFDGEATEPYKTTDKTNPVSEYGKSKLQGEENIRGTGCRHVIIRTSGLYSKYGKNMLMTVHKMYMEGDDMEVVNDAVCNPTSASELAKFIYSVVESSFEGNCDDWRKLLNFVGKDSLSWYDFASEAFKEFNRLMGKADSPKVWPISSEEYPTLARRPRFSSLDFSETAKLIEDMEKSFEFHPFGNTGCGTVRDFIREFFG